MGYFSNGTEFEIYESRYCARCVHNKGPGGCPVALLHLVHNYGQDDKTEKILDALIPRDGIYNEQCTMFHEDINAPDPNQLTMFDEDKAP